jgi:hypothetical protein
MAKFKFFSARRRNGDIILSLRGKQIASIIPDGTKFAVARASEYGLEDGFDTVAKAEEFVWRHWV